MLTHLMRVQPMLTHPVLIDSTQFILAHMQAKPTLELTRTLMLLHSYTLVKSLIAVNDHTTAARMLVRIFSHARGIGGARFRTRLCMCVQMYLCLHV